MAEILGSTLPLNGLYDVTLQNYALFSRRKTFEPRLYYIRIIIIFLSTCLSLQVWNEMLQQKAHPAQKYLYEMVIY